MLGRRQTFVVALVAACGAAVGGAVLVTAQTPGSVTGCVNNFGTFRVSADPSGFQGQPCQANFEHAVVLGTSGPPGPAGGPGPIGPTGPRGTEGAGGRDAGTAGSTTTSGPTTSRPAPQTNFVGGASFTIASRHFVRGEVDCPKGDLATGGSAAVVSPLGQSPAIGSPTSGPGAAAGRPVIGWLVEGTNTSRQSSSLRVTVVCSGPSSDPAGVVQRIILNRPLLRARKARGH